jgi:hypothetical protein
MAGVDRLVPITTTQKIDVTHRVIDPDQEALEELRAVRELGTSREKLIELFGGNGWRAWNGWKQPTWQDVPPRRR